MDAKTYVHDRLQASGSNHKDYVLCPTCDQKLLKHEVAKHCEDEMERLRQLHTKISGEIGDENSHNLPNVADGDRKKPWMVFQRVQKNRQSRLKQRTRKRLAPAAEQPSCPICNGHFPREEIQRHTEKCLRRSNENSNGRIDDNSSNDDDDGEEYEEYEWAGQKRIRASSMLEGGYAAIGIGTNRNSQQEDEEEDLNVDEDDTHIYGPAQYNECDVIPPCNELYETNQDNNVTHYMRRLITGNNSETNNAVESESSNEGNIKNNIATNDIPANNLASTDDTSTSTNMHDSKQIIDSLKAKLKVFENHIQNKYKCLICLDDYRNPAVSVACWHVHCEECWLRSLGERKLCPQCNLITTTKDLRRIYI